MPHAPFVHLRVQTAFSMLEGAMRPDEIAKACAAHAMPAVAITDRDVMFGVMEAADALSTRGVQPIIGCLLSIARPQGAGVDSLTLLAQSPAGYDALSRLVSRAHLDVDPHQPPHVTLEALAGATDGVLCLTGGGDGALARLLADGQVTAAQAYLAHLQAAFPMRLYIELTRTGTALEAASDAALIDLAYTQGLPLVATNPVQFQSPDFLAAHDAMLCISASRYVEEADRPRSNPECWFKAPDAMAALFADVPEAIANTLVIAQRCAVSPPKRKPILPRFSADGDEAGALANMAREGLARRLRSVSGDHQAYRDRLEFELSVITQMGFPGYFLIVADFIQWAKASGIPVGPGRGSGAGSVVAWALTITDLDPLRFGLLFERFLNPERVSMPDFDIDFCETRRGEVIRYVQEKYGADQVAQIITFGKLKARQVVKDVGRVLQMPYGQVDGISKLIPNNPANPVTLGQALDQTPELAAKRHEDEQTERLFDIALKLEGLYRHSSTHAAGVVIGDRPLDQLVPLYRDPRSDMAVTQFDMKYVEYAGLVKFDFLGLKTLSVLQRAVDLLAQRGVAVDLPGLPLDDPATFQLLARGETVGVFQLESEGMRRTLSLVKPDKFEDIIALVALYRPGPMDNIPTYAHRKHGREAPDYLHPLLEPVLAETYGVIIYQEQVMQIAQILAGYSLGEADLLRRAMGKKKKEEMDAQKSRFLEGAARNGIPAERAGYIFDLVEKFAGYGFNKSHAAAYALVSYHTAWMKANYPVEFYAASMAFDISQTDKLAVFVDDMKRLNVPMLPPDVNASGADFTVQQDGGALAVRYALGALKGVGEKAMQAMVDARTAGGPFRDLSDFADRVDPKSLNRKQMESLVLSGAFDSLCGNRAALFEAIDKLLAYANAAAEERTSAQVSLFGGGGGASLPKFAVPEHKPWPLGVQMEREREAFGFFLSAHPLDAFAHVLAAQNAVTYARAMETAMPVSGNRMPVTLAAQVGEVRWRTSAKGNRYLTADLSDQSGQFQASAFDGDAQGDLERAAADGVAVLLRCELFWSNPEEAPRVTVRAAIPLETMADHVAASLRLVIDAPAALSLLAQTLEERKGGAGQVRLELHLARQIAEIRLPGKFRVDPALKQRLAGAPGIVAAELSWAH